MSFKELRKKTIQFNLNQGSEIRLRDKLVRLWAFLNAFSMTLIITIDKIYNKYRVYTIDKVLKSIDYIPRLYAINRLYT